MAAPNPSSPTLFAVVISEKGGAERREAFDRSEISVGRVQGNDLMLPKGNVSKRHARLLFRDNRFIVTDLNSTNGTYVNRRRISQATIVREGDRVYIGDFVLRIELPDGESDEAPSSSEEVSVNAPVPSPPEPYPAPAADQGSRRPPTPPAAPALAPPPPALPPPSFAPPPHVAPAFAPPPPPPPVHPVADAYSQRPPVAESLPPGNHATALPPAASASSEPPEQSSSDRVASRSRDYQLDSHIAAHRGALRAVVGRVAEMLSPARLAQPVDEAARQRIEHAVTEQLAALRGEGALSPEVDDERVLGDARAELCALGPLGPLLNDEEVVELSVTGYGHVTAESGGDRRVVEPPFSSEESLERTITRLARLAGREPHADEAVVERRLPGDVRMRAVRGSLVGGRSLLILRKPRRVTAVVDDLVRRGTLSRAMATFLRHAMGAGANILVVGARESRASDVVNALANLSDAFWIVIAEDSELLAGDARVTRLTLGRDELGLRQILATATELSGSRLLIENLAGSLGAAALEGIATGTAGMVASAIGANLEQALARLAGASMTHSGLPEPAAKQQVAQAFDLVVEVARLRDHRYRVLRVAQVSGVGANGFELEDVFVFSFQRTAAGGAVEGTFAATGVVPRIAQDLGARGVSIDPGLFTRGGR